MEVSFEGWDRAGEFLGQMGLTGEQVAACEGVAERMSALRRELGSLGVKASVEMQVSVDAANGAAEPHTGNGVRGRVVWDGASGSYRLQGPALDEDLASYLASFAGNDVLVMMRQGHRSRWLLVEAGVKNGG